MRIELKRLQRQNFDTLSGFEGYKQMYERLEQTILANEQKQVLNDTSMATIFKLLRIQYALSHQDEWDKQDIFLMGGKANAATAQQQLLNASELATTAGEPSVDLQGALEQASLASNNPMSSNPMSS
jgi:hypothetical protein